MRIGLEENNLLYSLLKRLKLRSLKSLLKMPEGYVGLMSNENDKYNLVRFPSNPMIPIWRYMDFTKFIYMIEYQSLYFARSDRFDDPFEGSYPTANVKAVEDIKAYLASLSSHSPEQASQAKSLSEMPYVEKFIKRYSKSMYVNCWHVNEYESAAMWKLYLSSNEGIAIRSTAQKLSDTLNRALGDRSINLQISEVNYIDYNTTAIPIMFPSNFLFCKRKSFEHERELRATILEGLSKPEGGIDWDTETRLGIIVENVDIGSLVEKIYVAPNTPTWFEQLVRVIVERFELKLEVVKSSLYDSPIL